MKRKGKQVVGFLMILLLASGLIPTGVTAAETPVEISTKNNAVPTFKAGESERINLTLKNTSTDELMDVSITPDIKDQKKWPFLMEQQNYTKEVGSLCPGEIKDVFFDFTALKEIVSECYNINFLITASGKDTAIQTVYVNTIKKSVEAKGDNLNAQNQGLISPKGVQTDGGDAQGSINTGEYTSSDGNKGAFIPRVIVTGFSTNPKTVNAGDNFSLTVHLKNTSTKTKVNNMLFDFLAPTEGDETGISTPAFLPASGSSSLFLESIAANGTADISISLNAKANLLNKPYSLSLNMKYEDSQGNQIDTTSGLSIPVNQKVRFELSEIELLPEEVTVGEEANVMCNLYNMGRVKLYNVKATFEGEAIKKEEVFVGNVDAGGTASIDAMLEGKKESKGKAGITMSLSYEDEAGAVTTTTKELPLQVIASKEEMVMGDEVAVKEKDGVSFLPYIIGAVVVGTVVILLIMRKRKKKQRINSYEEELLDEIDGSFED